MDTPQSTRPGPFANLLSVRLSNWRTFERVRTECTLFLFSEISYR